MNKDLLIQALSKFFLGVLLLGALIFIPAWSLRYWQGWLLMGILFVPMFVAGIIMMAKNPDLLRKRLNAKEKEAEQKTVVALSGMLFVAAFVVAGLNWRFAWLVLPDWAVWVSAGLYGVVRHPMYMATTVLFLTMPLVLASPISFVIMLGYIPVISKRIKNEEKVLEEGLQGYVEYKKKVKYRMLPFVW